MNGKIMLNGKAYSSSGRPSREVTMSEWLALPDTKYTDGIVYYIKDVGGANQFPPLIYSDEEREVGVWRDGKPLYQKTITFTLSSGTNTVNLGVTNMSMCSFISGFMENGGLSTFIPFVDIEAGSSIDSWSVIIYRAVLSSGDITYRTASRFAGNTVCATFQYTKTTDAPGSGTWTTDGAYAKHYSTEEKVVGTWIDGKPIYECSWEFSPMLSVPPVSWTNTSITVASKNFKKIVGCEAVSGDGDIWGCISAGCTNGATTYVQLMSSRQQYNVSIEKLTLRYTKTTD